MPIPNIKNISKTKLSDETDFTKSLVTIDFDVPVQAYKFNVLGVSYDTGTVVDSSSRFISDIKSKSVSNVKLQTVRDIRLIEGDIIADIDFTELYQEGDNRINIYGKGLKEDAIFTQEWETQPYGTYGTTVNSVSSSILNVTSTNGDPMINMYGLGSFNPNLYRYIKVKYRVITGSNGSIEIFFCNDLYTNANAGQQVNGSFISDNTWRISFIDMWTHTNWKTHGNITGWRYDWCTASGVNMEIDYIKLVRDMDDEGWTPYTS